jgi:hypothetical protein
MRRTFVRAVTKAIVSPSDTSLGWPSVAMTQALSLLAPQSAAAQLLAEAVQLNLNGILSLQLPYIPPSGRPVPIFIGEGSPAPAVNLAVSNQVLGPARKILVMSAFTNEIQFASAQTAEKMISEALTYAVQSSVDAALFSNNAASTTAPPGLLHGVTPVTAATGSGAAAMADDLGNIAQAIAAAGIAVDDVIYITTPKLATVIRVQASPKFTNTVLASSQIPAGQVIGVAPGGLYVGYDGTAQIETSKETSVHFEDSNPLPIVGTGGVPAAPTRTAFQTDMSVVKVRAKCAWAALAGAVQVVSGVTW